MNILVVDDNADVKFIMGMALKRLGHEVMTADNPAQAIEILDGRAAYGLHIKFDAVLSDLKMVNQRDGLDLLLKVKELFPGIRRVLMSGIYAEAYRAEAINAGILCLDKPFDYWVLKSVFPPPQPQPALVPVLPAP